MNHPSKFSVAAKSEAHAKARDVRESRIEAQWKAITERAEARAGRTPEQQLAVLDVRLGKDTGATNERARLNKQIADRQKKAAKKEDKAKDKKKDS